jgi:hypothetical protein
MAAKKSDKRRRRKSHIKTHPLPRKEDMRKNPPLTILQTRFISALATSNSATEAAGKAGYSPKNLDKSAHQVMKALRGRVPQILDDLGLDEKFVIENHFAPKLTAKRVHYFQKDGEVTDIQLSEDLPTQMDAIHKIFPLHGSYAPRYPKEAAQYGVKIIRVDIPLPANEFNQFVDVIPESALSRHRPTNSAKPAVPENGKPRSDNNGDD